MTFSFDDLKNDRQLLSLIGVVVVVAIFAFQFIQSREQGRPSVYGRENLAAEIQAMKDDISSMSAKDSLESVDSYWLSLFDNADKHGLELKVANVTTDGRYQGPLQSRTGVLEGPTEILLATLYELQKSMPIFLYTIKIEGPNAEVTLSVVGV